MRRKTTVLAASVAAIAVLATTALAVLPGETPFPSPTVVTLFVTANTVTGPSSALGEGVIASHYPRGNSVIFKVFAADSKSGKVLTADDVKYAYIKIPNQPNVKLTYTAPTYKNGPNFTATWTIPATYPTGLVNFVARFQSKDKKYGTFVQIPVVTSQLTVT